MYEHIYLYAAAVTQAVMVLISIKGKIMDDLDPGSSCDQQPGKETTTIRFASIRPETIRLSAENLH